MVGRPSAPGASRRPTNRKEAALNARIEQLLRDLRLSLARALSESAEAGQALERIRKEGWTLYLVVDRPVDDEDDDEESEAFELTVPPRLTEGDPAFKIDGRDLSFLKSVGIDPTRKLRRRRSG